MSSILKFYVVLRPTKHVIGNSLNGSDWYLVKEISGNWITVFDKKKAVKLSLFCVAQFIGKSKNGQTFLMEPWQNIANKIFKI